MKNHQYDLKYIIKNKFNPNIKFLIMKYSQEIRQEQKEYEEIQEQMKEVKNNGIK